LGTSKGLIFEADIGSDGDRLITNNWKQVSFALKFVIVLLDIKLIKSASFQAIFHYTEVEI
jgi:hypothetical protein